MGPNGSAHLVLHVASLPPEEICSSASTSWLTFYPCPSELCRLSIPSSLQSGSRSAAGVCAYHLCTNVLLEFVHLKSCVYFVPSISWHDYCAVKTLCTETRCALLAQIAGLSDYMTGTWMTGIWWVWLLLVATVALSAMFIVSVTSFGVVMLEGVVKSLFLTWTTRISLKSTHLHGQ